jgi:hypothetical protein
METTRKKRKSGVVDLLATGQRVEKEMKIKKCNCIETLTRIGNAAKTR